METFSYRRTALFFLLGSALFAMSPRSASAGDDSWNAKDGGATGQEMKNEHRSGQGGQRSQECKECQKPRRNMHPELQIAEPFQKPSDSEQDE